MDDDYESSPVIEFPIKYSDNSTIEDMVPLCAVCGVKTCNPRGHINSYNGCLDINVGGLCTECDTVTWGRIRFYSDGRCIMRGNSGNWVEMHWSRPWYMHLVDWVKDLFWRT